MNPLDLHERLVTKGTEWAEAEYRASCLEETRKTLLAQLMQKSTLGSMSAKETEAMASDEYETHIEGMCEARYLANKAKVEYDSAKAFIELLRTQSANERAANRVAT